MMGVVAPKEEQEAPSLPMERETPVMMEGEKSPPPPPETLTEENARLRARVAALEALVERSGLALPARSEEATPPAAETGCVEGVVAKSAAAEGSALTDWELRKWVERWCGGDREGLPHISTWNTSRVSDMSKLFENQRVFNDDIGTWDTSGVTSMEWIFMGASSFNQPIGNWRVDKVTNMSSMFHGAKSFNQPLNDWRVDNVTTMHCMFLCARSFNQPLNDWRVDNVTSMGSMFYSASAFNQPLGDWQLRPDCNTCNMFGHPDYNTCTNFHNSRPVKKGSWLGGLALSKAKKTSRETCCAIS